MEYVIHLEGIVIKEFKPISLIITVKNLLIIISIAARTIKSQPAKPLITAYPTCRVI